MAKLFDPTSPADTVRLIRSPDHIQSLDDLLTVTAPSSTPPTPPTVTLSGFSGPAVYTSADLMVKTSASSHPSQVDYRLIADPSATGPITSNILQKNGGNGFQVVAENIVSVDLEYNPNAADAKTVRVTITGTVFDLTNKQTKNRQITRLISLKNN